MRRRALLLGGVAGTAVVACRSWTHPITRQEAVSPHELATLAAMAETFVPGGDGTPGATEVGAVSVIVHPAYGVNPYISEVVSDLDEWCLVAHHGVFASLSPERRELALEQRMGLRGRAIQSLYLPVYEGILALTKLAFFGALSNKAGMNYIGFPGASRGYAPGSAAGAYASTAGMPIARGGASAITVDGEGAVSAVRATAYVTSGDDVRATLRIRAPGGAHHDLAVRADGGDGLVDDVLLPLTGGPAAGTWRLEIAAHTAGSGRLELWSIRLRTDLDDRAAIS
ncbi:MAG TPA: gluconate 2-dehydrogenase subunit 3 family protein [Kofleriaceae bacterium]|nr:gluconate 2-dehydrogenase subunit 3 family protein [Kofleriaceae bacterium]